MQIVPKKILLGFLLGLIFLSGCSNQAKLEQDAHEYSEITVTHANFAPKLGETIAWHGPILWSTNAIKNDANTQAFLKQLVNSELRDKGFRLIEDEKQADYIISAAVVNVSDPHSDQIIDFFRLFPDIRESKSGLDSAEALIGIIRRDDIELALASEGGANFALWRSSVIAFVLGEKVDAEVREQRYRFLTKKLMSRLPNAK